MALANILTSMLNQWVLMAFLRKLTLLNKTKKSALNNFAGFFGHFFSFKRYEGYLKNMESVIN